MSAPKGFSSEGMPSPRGSGPGEDGGSGPRGCLLLGGACSLGVPTPGGS